jgi:hypothetical protein
MLQNTSAPSTHGTQLLLRHYKLSRAKLGGVPRNAT